MRKSLIKSFRTLAIIALYVLSGCVNHHDEFVKTQHLKSNEEVTIEYSLVSPFYSTAIISPFADKSPYAINHIYGKKEQYAFIQEIAENLLNSEIFNNVELSSAHTNQEIKAVNKIKINFIRSAMGAPTPVLFVDVSITIQGQNRIEITNNYSIVSSSEFEEIISISANSKKTRISKQLTNLVTSNLKEYFDVNKLNNFKKN